jgi:hypothetical protein
MAQQCGREPLASPGGGFQQGMGEPPERLGRGKYARMARHSTHGPGVFVVYFSYQDAPPPGTGLGGGIGRRARWQHCRTSERPIRYGLQAKRVHHTLQKQGIQRLLILLFEDIGEQNKSQITIDGLRARRIYQGTLEDGVGCLATAQACRFGLRRQRPTR